MHTKKIHSVFLKRDFDTEPPPTYRKTNRTDPGRPGFAPTAKKNEEGPKRSPRQQRARGARKTKSRPPCHTRRHRHRHRHTAAELARCPLLLRPARTDGPTNPNPGVYQVYNHQPRTEVQGFGNGGKSIHAKRQPRSIFSTHRASIRNQHHPRNIYL